MKPCQPPVSVYKRLLCQVISVLLVWQPVAPSVAAALTPTSGATTDTSASGVPVLNIATPNGAGVSHNTFTDYNVGPQGLILNNATGQLNRTQLAGIIQNNPHLTAGHEATAIINEVTGGNRSQLQGYTEVAGKAANVMVANPYGITCSGCGFINTPQVTLTTGKPQFGADGSLVAVETTKGSITVEGQGLDAGSSDRVAIITRAMQINAGIYARDLSVTLGANRVGQDGSVTPVAGEGPAPSVSVDTGALGGMYASRIHLVSNETGVGVNLGNLRSSVGDMQIDAAGRLTLADATAAGQLSAGAQSIALQGTQQSGGDMALTSQGQLAVQGSRVASGGNMALSAGQLTSGSDAQVAAAGNITASAGHNGQWQGRLTAGRDLRLDAGELTSNGLIVATGDASVTAGYLNNAGTLAAGGNTQLVAQQLTNDGLLQAQGSQSLTTGTLSNSGKIQSGGAGYLRAGTLDSSGLVGSQQSLGLQVTDQMQVGEQGSLFAGDQLSVSGGDVTVNGAVTGKNGLNLNTGSVTTGQNARVISGGDIQLNAAQQALNGQLSAAGNVSLNADTLSVGTTGTVHSDNRLALSAGQGALLSGALDGQTLSATGGGLQLTGSGSLASAGDMQLSARQQQLDGTTSAGHDLILSARQLSAAQSGKTAAQNDVQAAVTDNGQWGGSLVAGRDLTFSAGSLSNSGTLAASRDGQFSFGTLNNSGLLQSLGTQQLTGDIFNNSGTAQSGSDQTFTLNQFSNQGLTGARGNLLLGVRDAVTTGDSSTLLSDGRLALKTAQADLGGTLTAGGNVALDVAALSSRAGSVQRSQGDVSISATEAGFDGFLSADGSLALTAQRLSTGSDSQTQGKNALGITVADTAGLSGKLVTPGTLSVQAGTLTSSAALGAGDIDIHATTLTNTGTATADNNLHIQGDTLIQQGNLTAQNRIALDGATLVNQGSISAGSLTLQASNSLTNQQTGGIYATGDTTLTTPVFTNNGTLAAQTLEAGTGGMTNNGVLQGSSSASLTAGTLINGATGQILLSGLLDVQAGDTQNAGHLQGSQLNLTGNTLAGTGTALGTGGLTVQMQGDLSNGGRLMLSGNVTVAAATLENAGQLLSDNALSVTASQLTNQGQIQGDSLALKGDSAGNSGNLIGLKALTVQLQQDLTNATTGSLLSQGALTVTASHVTSDGHWQADTADLHARQLDLNGAIQTTTRTALSLTGALNTQAQGSIVSTGLAVLQAADLNNQGSWSADNLSLQAGTLTSNGAVTGVSGLTASVSGLLQVQQGGALLSGAGSTLNAGSVSNSGRIQASDLVVTTDSLTNSGQVQGQHSLQGTVQNAITNLAGGTLRSQGTLDLGAQSLLNQGQVQGDGISHLTLTDSLSNQGSLLTGGALTLRAPLITNGGVLQAQGLTLTGSSLTNSGTLTGLGDSSLQLDQAGNQGQLQGDRLQLTANVLHNSGTVFGGQQLTLNLQNTDNQSGGRLYSAGDLTLITPVLNPSGSLLALGNMSLQLGSDFTQSGTLAAGQNLSLSTTGNLTIQGTLQGNGIQLSTAGDLVNNGQLQGGSGTVAADAGNITLNGSGSVQSGGNIRLSSRGQLTNSGFVGAAGDVLMSAPGLIQNSALLYAGNNMQLLSDSLHNYRGDILAGNSLWLMRDAAGNAGSEVVNTSGDIETTTGDINIRTGHLLNQRDGLSSSTSYQVASGSPASGGATSIRVRLGDLNNDQLGIYQEEHDSISVCGGDSNCGGNNISNDTAYWDYLAPNQKGSVQKYLVDSTEYYSAQASGGAGRIAGNNNVIINAGTLDNLGSNLLAGNGMILTGGNLNNQSYLNTAQNKYITYVYSGQLGDEHAPDDDIKGRFSAEPDANDERDGKANSLNSTVTYTISSAPLYETVTTGEGLRAVIQAGGALSAGFSNTISNTATAAYAGGLTHAVSAPGLSDRARLQPVSGTQSQSLAAGQNLVVGSVQWTSAVSSALQQIGNQGAALTDYPVPAGNNGLFVASQNPSSPYLITLNPQLGTVGKTDASLFSALNSYLAQSVGKAGGALAIPAAGQVSDPAVQPGTPTTPRTETAAIYTDANQFLGSSYLLKRLNLNPGTDYRFLGDAAFDTRYVSNAVLSQTGQRYIGGTGSDLAQMRYLLDNAADQQQALGLSLGVSLTPDQVSRLTRSIVWWEDTTINGQTVLAPKLYLAPGDAAVAEGSIIAGNTVSLDSGSLENSGSTLQAVTQLAAKSNSTLNNLKAGLISSGGDLQLSALGDINNTGSSIAGQTVSLTSVSGSINNITQTQQWAVTTYNGKTSTPQLTFSQTQTGDIAGISAGNTLSLRAGHDINNTGAKLTAGTDLQLVALNDLNLSANVLSTDKATKNSSSDTVASQASEIRAGGTLLASAGNNLTLAASHVDAGGSALLNAGNDLNLNAGQTVSNHRSGASESHQTGVDNSTLTAGQSLQLTAGRDITSQAAGLAAEGNVQLSAGRDVNLLSEAATQGDSYRSKKKTVINDQVRQQGTSLSSGGSTVITAGRDITSQAADVVAQQDIGLSAGRNVNLSTATESDYHYQEETKTKKGFLSRSTTHTISETSDTREKGSLLSGDNVSVRAGQDILVHGSQVAGDGTVALNAGNNVSIDAATNTDSLWNFSETRKSGLMGSGGIGFSIGSSMTRHDLKENGTTQSQSTSTVGSTRGDVSITAGNQLHVSGSDLIAGNNLSLTGDSVVVDPGHDRRTTDEKFEQRTSGLTVALTGAVVDAVNNAVTAAKAAGQQSDSRLAALQATKSVLSGYQAEQGKEMADITGEPDAGIHVSVSLTTQQSRSEQRQTSDTVSGSTLNAGNGLSITATGKQQGADSGDISISGSSLKSRGDMSLDAARDIRLAGAASTQQTTGSNSSSGGGVGVSFGAGQGSAGISVFASVNAARGSEKGDGTTWTESTLDAGQHLSLTSGRDTTLAGAQASGKQVTANVGRDLTITSLQDSDHYDSKQTSVSAGGSFTFGSMTGSGYINASQDKMHSVRDSVAEQSGLFAGTDGFDVTVGNHTQLNGGAIGSTATADKNRLDTGTLGFSDIHNEADYQASHTGFGFSSSGSPLGQLAAMTASTMVSGMGGSGHAEGTTQAAVSQGSIVIRDQSHQQQDISGLQRDVTKANDTVSPIFDKQKEQDRLQAAQLIGDIGNQVSDIVRTEGDLKGLEAAKKASGKQLKDGATEKERQDWLASLRNSSAYKKVMETYGTGSDLQRAITAATAAVSGLSGGNLGSALSGAASPYIANEIGKYITQDNALAGIMAHAVVNAALAKASGQNAAVGAAGAAVGEATGMLLAKEVYGKSDSSQLTDTEKQTISALSTLASGLAGGLTGGSSLSATQGAQAGKTTVENNWLSATEAAKKAALERKEKAGTLTADEAKELADTRKLDKDRDQAIHDICTQGNKSGGACSALVAQAQQALNTYGGNVSYNLIFKDLYPQDAANASAILKGLDEGSITRDAAITAIAKATGKGWDDVASQYDSVMQLHGMVSTLAGFYGANWISEAESQLAKNSSENIRDGAGAGSQQPKVRIEYAPEGTYINQTSHESGGSNLCGPTSCAMVISDKNGNVVNLDSVVKQFDNIRPTGVNMNEMSVVLSKNGVVNKPTDSLLPNQLREYASQGQTTIVNIDTGKGGHFIVVDSMKKVDGVDYYMIRDPYNGPAGVRADVLDRVMNYNGIILK